MAAQGPAFDSGMRGSRKKVGEASPAYEETPGEETDQESEHSPAEIIADHVHGPDESGHHHLNLTTLAEAMHKKKGIHDK